MDLLLILTYTAICFGIFKFFKIPLNKWSVPTAVLGGVIIIGSLLLLMNYNHPYTERAQMVTVTLPIIPEVEGVVVEVTANANKELKKGDFLFRIDPTAYEAKVESIKAEIESAEQNVEMLQARLASENADIAQAKAQRDLAMKDADRYRNGSTDRMKSPFTDQEVVRAQQTYLASQAQWRSSLAKRDQTTAQLNALVNGENAGVYRLKANLKEAEYFLAKTVVRAPSDGYATQLFLKPGMFVRPLPLRPVMVFVPAQKTSVYAVFRQNSALRLTAGDEAEVVFNGLPGSVVKGKVKQILPAIANSSYQAQGHLQGLSLDPKLDGIYAEIELNNIADVERLPAGTMGQVAVYSGYLEHVAIMRKILLRMTSWTHYLYIDH
ncbi:multidrug resistance efflux pump [Buttiauxella brennerae ATCC 51605]|uniref:Multidrug resistance efflux pump n=1 Tax=Buttiauxella brennerae ATCC 51605 TaxID=1354251 RepID=A0A1B7IE44_9ENTR|nr:HlyD family secretion protein [Buttiauxella brennerae]OAT27602.1 multidrug resistance efflux pump [Buttiauxella brennerae ATCC 51605]